MIFYNNPNEGQTDRIVLNGFIFGFITKLHSVENNQAST